MGVAYGCAMSAVETNPEVLTLHRPLEIPENDTRLRVACADGDDFCRRGSRSPRRPDHRWLRPLHSRASMIDAESGSARTDVGRRSHRPPVPIIASRCKAMCIFRWSGTGGARCRTPQSDRDCRQHARFSALRRCVPHSCGKPRISLVRCSEHSRQNRDCGRGRQNAKTEVTIKARAKDDERLTFPPL